MAIDVVAVGDAPLAARRGARRRRPRGELTPRSSPATRRGRGLRRGRRERMGSSSATAAPASIPPRAANRPACASRSSGDGAPRRRAAINAAPDGGGTEVELVLSAVRAHDRHALAQGTRALSLDDHALFRAGCAPSWRAVDVVGDAATVADAVALIRELAPDVVLLDSTCPTGRAGCPASGSRRRERDAFLALSVSDAAEDVSRSSARRALLRDQDDLRQRPRRRRPPRTRRRRGFSPRLAASCSRLRGAGRRGRNRSARRRLDQLTPASARCGSPSRAATCTRRSPTARISARPSRPTSRRAAKLAALQPSRAVARAEARRIG